MNAGRVRAREEELALDPRVSSPAAGRRAGTGEGAAGTGVSLCLGHSHGNSVVTFLPLKKKKKKDDGDGGGDAYVWVQTERNFEGVLPPLSTGYHVLGPWADGSILALPA